MRLARVVGLAALGLALGLPVGRGAAADDLVARGAYLTRIGGCFSCHTDAAHGGQPLAGGRALATPFGTFYSPNITSDRETGIGAWTDAQFRRALREGVRPDGANYFPVFPYPSFTNITDDDLAAMLAYLKSRPPVRQANQAHEVGFLFSWRFLQTGWKLLFFRPGPFASPHGANATEARGAYLVTALSHCGECHTPRNALGAMRPSLFLAGTPDGPDGALVPNITQDKKTGIGEWTKDDVVELLATGTTPEQSTVKGAMREAIQDGLKFMTDADRAAVADYLLVLPPIDHPVHKR
jgi:mono/diheme cytochrome c family protein